MGTSVASPTILKQNSGASKIGTASGDNLQVVFDALASALGNDFDFSNTIADALALKAALASPAFTGTPTAPTASATANTTQIASTAMVQAAIAGLVDSSPAAMDTLKELAAALGDDPNFATTIMNALALKAALDSPAFTGTPTAPTASAGTNTTQVATTEFVQQEKVEPGWKHIATAVCSSDTSADFALAGYETYFLVFDSVIGGNSPSLRTSTDGGSSYDSLNYSWGNLLGSTLYSTNGTNRMVLATSGQGINGFVQICAAGKESEKTHAVCNLALISNANPNMGHGYRDIAEINDAIQFFFDGDMIDSGTISLYGLNT